MKKIALIALLGLTASPVVTSAEPACCMPSEKVALMSNEKPANAPAAPVDAKAAYEKIKTLAGKWEGMGEHNGAIEFKVIANGTAVVETMVPGTKYEMVNVYALDGDRLLVTHYCGAGNQPRMKLASVEGSTFKFDFLDATNLPSRDLQHMGALELTIDAEKLKENWTSFQKDKANETMTFDLKRAAAK